MNRFVMNIFILLIMVPLMVMGAGADDKKVMVISGTDGPWLGVKIENLSTKMLKNLNLESGVRVKEVLENSPAQKAGLEEDDILVSFNGKELKDSNDLVKMVQKSKIDDEVTIGYFRDGKKKKVSATLAKNEQKNVMRWFGADGSHKIIETEKRAWLGVETENLNDQLREFFGAPEKMGVLVKKIVKESPAETVGLKAGDVIINVADRKIKNTNDLLRSINYYDPDEVVTIKVIREKKEKEFKVKLAETKGHGSFRFYGSGDELIEIKEMDMTAPNMEFHHQIDVDIDEKELKEIQEDMEDLDNNVKVKKIRIETYGDET